MQERVERRHLVAQLVRVALVLGVARHRQQVYRVAVQDHGSGAQLAHRLQKYRHRLRAFVREMEIARDQCDLARRLLCRRRLWRRKRHGAQGVQPSGDRVAINRRKRCAGRVGFLRRMLEAYAFCRRLV